MTKLIYRNFEIGNVKNSSGVFYGQNIHINFTSKTKINDGFGGMPGYNNESRNNKFMIRDDDLVDSAVNVSEEVSPDFLHDEKKPLILNKAAPNLE